MLQYLQTRPINEAFNLFVMLKGKIEKKADEPKDEKDVKLDKRGSK